MTASTHSSLAAAPLASPSRAAGNVAQRRAGLAMSVATFSMAAASAIQAVLYLSAFGASGRTDGFFVAFALYTTIGVFSQSLRLTSVPLLVEPGARMNVREFGAALVLIAIPIVVVTVPLAGPLAHLLAPGLDRADRAVTQDALPILGIATALQLLAAGGATVLAIRDRFTVVAASYIAGAAAGLATYLALMSVAGELTLGWSMLAMAAVTLGWMLGGLRATGGFGPSARLRPRALLAKTGIVLGRTSAYLAFNVLFVVTLAYASRSAPGDATVLSYAYLFASYLVAGTGMALGMSRIPEMTRAARAERVRMVRATVPVGFRYAMLLVAPALAGLVTAGAPLIHAVFPASLTADNVGTLRTFGMLLAAWTVAALLLNFLLPAMFALGRSTLVNALAPVLLAVHVLATIVGHRLWGEDGAVAAFFVAPLAFAVVLVAAVGDGAGWAVGREVAIDAARFVALAAAAFGIAQAIGATAGSGLGPAVLVAAIGTAVYAAGALLLARRQLQVLFGSLRPATG